jgi:hypothetical protein
MRRANRSLRVVACLALGGGLLACEEKEGGTGADAGQESSTGGTGWTSGTGTEDGSSAETGTGESGTSATSEAETGEGPCGEGQTLCGDECVDLQTDDQNCGECGRTCRWVHALIETCEEGVCQPTWSSCFEQGTYLDCDEACEAEGETCVAQGCYQNNKTAYYFTSKAACDDVEGNGDFNGPCYQDFPGNWGANSWARCCCTDTPP